MTMSTENLNGSRRILSEPAPDSPDVAWVRDRVLAGEELAAERHQAIDQRLARIEAMVAGAPSLWEKRGAYFLATLITVLLGYVAQRLGIDPSTLPRVQP